MHVFELDEITAFALQMIEKRCQGLELLLTSNVGTVIDVLCVRWALQVLVEMALGSEFSVAEVTLERASVPSVVFRPSFRLPSQQLVREETLLVTGADLLVNLLTIDARGAAAAAVLEMMGESTCSCETSIAEWTSDVFTLMRTG